MSDSKPVDVSSEEAFRFFYNGLRKQPFAGRTVRRDETKYAASILAHFSETSTSDPVDLPPLADLSAVFDQFVCWPKERPGPTESVLELAGSQTLLLAGFFREQMRGRHNVHWYDELGSEFYRRLSDISEDRRRRELFGRFGRNFPVWTLICAGFERSWRERRYLLRLN